MSGNICPQCGNAVMSYKRFFREAEPYKISECDGCASSLRRSPKVYAYLFIMTVVLCIVVLPVLFMLAKAKISFWIIFPILIVVLAVWTILTNYLAWRFIGWVLVREEKKS